MKTDREVLEGALELVSKDGGWCKGAFCRNADGTATDVGTVGVAVNLGEAVSFCLEGALRQSVGNWWGPVVVSQDISDQVFRLERRVTRAIMGKRPDHQALCWVNDRVLTSQEEAILALKTAIADLPD